MVEWLIEGGEVEGRAPARRMAANGEARRVELAGERSVRRGERLQFGDVSAKARTRRVLLVGVEARERRQIEWHRERAGGWTKGNDARRERDGATGKREAFCQPCVALVWAVGAREEDDAR